MLDYYCRPIRFSHGRTFYMTSVSGMVLRMLQYLLCCMMHGLKTGFLCPNHSTLVLTTKGARWGALCSFPSGNTPIYLHIGTHIPQGCHVGLAEKCGDRIRQNGRRETTQQIMRWQQSLFGVPFTIPGNFMNGTGCGTVAPMNVVNEGKTELRTQAFTVLPESSRFWFDQLFDWV